jgi:hypothetical protein
MKRILVSPFKTDPPLIVNPDAILTFPFPRQFFKPVGGWHAQIIQGHRIVKHSEFSESHLLDISRKFSRSLEMKDFLRFSIFEWF